MTPLHLLDACGRHRRRLAHARRAASAGEEAASYDLALSTRAFSRRTRRVVEDKLEFSATLVRAGEVDAASRLIEDLQRDVRDHEAALIERVNEARVGQRTRHDRVTRLRVVRALASALVSACTLSMSLLGVAFAAWVVDSDAPARHGRAVRHDARAGARPGGDRPSARRDARVERVVRIGGMAVALSPDELRTYRALIADGGAHDGRLEAFLLSVLPAAVADTVTDALAADATGVLAGAAQRVERAERRARASGARAEAEGDDRAPAASDGDGATRPAGGDDGDDGGDGADGNGDDGDGRDAAAVDADMELLVEPDAAP
ncbi:MAG TPA: hypothetical protein VHJ34_15470 [Actinomycetota bacterium]|nr:hypothetical protein [Actinomycetota bacterium]